VVSKTWKWLAAVTALLGVGLPLVGAIDGQAADAASPALCADDNTNPEPGRQGDTPSGVPQEWDCGVHEIGFLAGANGAMAVAGTCAYTGGGADETEDIEETYAGVRVIDVSDPRKPKLARVLDTGSRELLAAEVSPDGSRALLATRHRDTVQQDGQVLGRDMLIDIWNIHDDCTNPQFMRTMVFPTQSKTFGDPPNELGGPAHNLKFNPSVTKLYGTMPLHEVDLTNLEDPSTWTVRDLQCAITKQYHEPFMAIPGLCQALGGVDHPFGTASNSPTIGHEPTFSPDGSRLYVGGQQSHQPHGNALLVLDMTGPDPIWLSTTEEAPGHSIDFMTIHGHEYLLHSNEIASTSCVPEQGRPRTLGFGDRAYILDISTETAPVKTSEIILEDSKVENCGVSGPGNTGGPTTAYHDVDDSLDSSYAVINFGPAGFRFFDIRTPEAPVEEAYFNWGTSEHTKSYIIPETGHIWVSDADGFKVLALEPQVIEELKLAPPNVHSCANDLWKSYKGEDDRDFENEGDCVSYAATRQGEAAG
jgi:hypothetical protein